MRKSRLLLSTAAFVLAAATSAQAGTLYISNMQYEGAPNPSQARGTGFLILDDAQASATVYATHDIATRGTSPLTLGHIHRAPAGVNGPVIFGFTPVPPVSPVGPLVWAIPQAELVNLNNAGLYMQFHTQLNPAGEIRGQIVRAMFAPAATTDTQMLVANALDVSAGRNTDLDQVLMGRFASTVTTATRTQSLDDLSGRTLYSAGRQAVEAMAGFQDSLFEHAEDIAGSGKEGFGGFVGGGMIFGTRETDSATAGAKISRPYVMAGFDYGMGGGANVGLSVGYADGKDEFRNAIGETSVKTTSVQAHFSGGNENVVFAAAVGYGWVNADSTRSIASLGRTATGAQDGKVLSAGAKVSVPLKLDGDSIIAPYGLIDYQVAKMDAYTETGASSVSLMVSEHKEKSSAAELGAAFEVPMGAGDDVHVRLLAGYRYLLEDGKDTIETRFVGSAATFNTLVRSPGINGVRVGANLGAKVSDNMFISAGYNGTISGRTKLHALEARLTLKM
ncbi:MAG: autotransporter domain-containing protein [Rhodospirillaceae bacterium]